MASFRKRGKNWEYRIRYVDPITGKKRERSDGGYLTKAEAEYAASEAYINLKDGNQKTLNKNIYFKDYADTWFENYKSLVKETSLRSRKAYLNTIKKTFDQLRMKNLDSKIYQKEMNKLSDQYKKNTLIAIHQIMKMITDAAVEDGYFKESPIKNFKFPRYEQSDEKIEFWEFSSVMRFQQYCLDDIAKTRKKESRYITLEKQRDLAMYYLMVYGGMRIGEVCALSVNDYFPLTKEISISKTLGSPESNQLKSTWKVYPPKTKNAYRTIPLPEIAYKQVEQWIKLRKEYTILFSSFFHESQFLFCKKDGTPLTTRDLRTKFDVIVKKANLPKISPHGLRHTFTALQIQAGTDPKTLQMFLGHADIKTTLNIYAHLTEEKRKETATRFDQMLKNLEGGAKVGQSSKRRITDS